MFLIANNRSGRSVFLIDNKRLDLIFASIPRNLFHWFRVVFIGIVLGMVREGHQSRSSSHNNSNSNTTTAAAGGGGGRNRTSKKNKTKKIPQRGLGVAQLEKLRLEEQHKNISSSSSSGSNISPAVMFPAQPRPPSLSSLNPQNPILFRPTSFLLSSTPVSTMDLFAGSSSHPPSFQQNSHFDLSKPDHMPPQLTSQLVNKSPVLSSLSGENLQIEPPSLQTYSSYMMQHSIWSEQSKNLVGMHSQAQSALAPVRVPHLSTSYTMPNESVLTYGKCPFKVSVNLSGNNSDGREGSLMSTTHQDDTSWKKIYEVHANKRKRENGASVDNIELTLGSSLTQPASTLKLPMMTIPPRPQKHEHHEFSLSPSQVSAENVGSCSTDSSRLPYYFFLPEEPTAHETSSNKHNGEHPNEGVDTTLKLA